ncbi:hypothetical protein SAMN05192583_0879 [Sphingomonas gellani]|uniref:Uncharacterized protein n=1 Tax=Sphingomonas gellani TaxID=1166340 RepID=A0A1H7ZY06_9SPHN|nr:hypothetical protein [Sphingomonas gellani]SEM62604.1 hypothetical protein SAMN05192583_0879 [Sphingomonas gellani]
MATLLTQTAFAKHRGVGKSAVSNWKKAGLLVFADDGTGALLVDVTRTEAKLNARLDPTRGRPTAGMQDGSVPELPIDGEADEGSALQQRNLARVRADVAEEDLVGKRMKNAELARELVPAMDAERRLGQLGRMARERVQSELRARAERLAAEREPRAIMALLDEATDKAFHALAAAILNGAADVSEDEEVIAEAA